MRASDLVAALRLVAPVRGRVTGSAEVPPQVNAHHRVPLLFARRDEHAVAEEAGVVHQHVEPSEGLDRRRHEPLRPFPIRDVVAVRHGLSARRANGLHDLVRGRAPAAATVGLHAEIVHHHLRPLPRELEGVLPPDASPGSGHDGHAPFADAFHPSLSRMVTLACPPPSHIVCRP